MEWGVSSEGDRAPVGAPAGASVAEPSGAIIDVPAGAPTGEGRRILVCDDTEQIRQLIRVNLELEGYEVIEAVDGQEALDILGDATRTLPDVITLDALMPRRDGWWVVAMIRADPRLAQIPIVMVTASAQSQDRVQAKQADVDGFVAKPFDPDDLLALIGTLALRGRIADGSEPAQLRP